MRTVRVDGKKQPRLLSPEVRSLDDAATTLRSIAVVVENEDEQAHMENTAKILDEQVAKYGPKKKEDKPAKAAK